MWNRLICAGRSAWYGTAEPLRLAWERSHHHPSRGLISAYVPTHNRIDLLLSRALPSIRAQTYCNIEIIVAAHGCTDDTARRVAGYDPRLRVIEVPRKRTYPPTAENHWLAGPVVPANAALKACRGEWIMRVDDDDCLVPDAIEKLLHFAQTHDLEFVSAAHEGPDGVVAPYNVGGIRVGRVQTWLYRSYLRFMKYNSQCFRKRINRVNDVDLQCRMRAAGVRMGYLNDIVARVMPRPGNADIGSKAYLKDARKTEELLKFV